MGRPRRHVDVGPRPRRLVLKPRHFRGGGGGGGGGTSSYAGYFHLNYLRFYSDHEGNCQNKGKPDFLATYARYDFDNEAFTTDRVRYWSIDNSECDGRNIVLPNNEKHPFPWRPDRYFTYYVQWFELDDNDNNVKLEPTVGFRNPLDSTQTASVKISITFDDDDVLGKATVHLDDPTPNEYNTGFPDVKVTLQE